MNNCDSRQGKLVVDKFCVLCAVGKSNLGKVDCFLPVLQTLFDFVIWVYVLYQWKLMEPVDYDEVQCGEFNPVNLIKTW